MPGLYEGLYGIPSRDSLHKESQKNLIHSLSGDGCFPLSREQAILTATEEDLLLSKLIIFSDLLSKLIWEERRDFFLLAGKDLEESDFSRTLRALRETINDLHQEQIDMDNLTHD